MNKPGLSFVIHVYNEEKRIAHVLDHAIVWADEVLVFDKQSTDKTREICASYGPKVRVISVPYSNRGAEDVAVNFSQATNDWIFGSTASEIPTKNLIEQIRQLLAQEGDELDLVYVPRKMYSLGIHSMKSPWSVSYYPFLMNRHRVIFDRELHHSFKVKDPKRTATIPYAEDCHVLHLTHQNARDFVSTSLQYFQGESESPDPTKRLQECFDEIAKAERNLLNGGPELFGHYCAWHLYWMGTALFLWEKSRGLNVAERYQQIAQKALWENWGVKSTEAAAPIKGFKPIDPLFNVRRLKRQAQLNRVTSLFTRARRKIMRILRLA